MAFADDDGSTLESYGGGWHLIVPNSKDEHLKLFEVRRRACERVFAWFSGLTFGALRLCCLWSTN